MKNNSKNVILEFNLPEFNKKEINLKILKNSLSIKAQKKKEKKVKKKDFFHQEKSHNIFNYITTLPDINPTKAKITFKKGILKIIAPKK